MASNWGWGIGLSAVGLGRPSTTVISIVDRYPEPCDSISASFIVVPKVNSFTPTCPRKVSSFPQSAKMVGGESHPDPLLSASACKLIPL